MSNIHIPCYFDMWLEIDSLNQLNLVFEVPREIVEASVKLMPRLRKDVVESLQGGFSFDKDHFGDSEIILIEERAEWWRLRVTIPHASFDHCPICKAKGTIIDKHLGAIRCRNCRGCKSVNTNNFSSDTLVDSLKSLFSLVYMNDSELITENNRPMLVYLMIADKNHNTTSRQPIYGYYSKVVQEYLEYLVAKGLADDFNKEVQQAMFTGFCSANKTPTIDFDFSCRLSKDGELTLRIPGENYCSIHSDSGPPTIYPPGDKAYKKVIQLSCHNVDNSKQLLAIIIGMAQICTNVRDFLKNQAA